VEILDNKFSPARITVEEGDKVWFYWSKEKVAYIEYFKIQ
jgi:plastocyanin